MAQIEVALLGFGNVGRAFCRYLETAESIPIPIHIKAIADRSGGVFPGDGQVQRLIAHKESGRTMAEFETGEILNPEQFVRSLPAAGVSLLVESLPTNIVDGEPALGLITSALQQGTNVVTVDKGPLVHGFVRLMEAARKGGAQFGYSGTTGVSVPDGLGDQVLEIRGVLNGTSNYVLSEMQQHQASFQEALDAARADGIAEPDPTLDIEGWDTACKILILANALMGANARLSDVSRTGIGLQTEALIDIARQTGRVVRLVGRARRWQGRIRVSVAPKLLTSDSPFYAVSGTSKAAIFRTESQGEVLAAARSGRDAISQAIVDDIYRISRTGN